ncbi:unnamed protein product, partial [Allacma fusca]
GKCLFEEFLKPQNYSTVPDIIEFSETTPLKRKDFSVLGVIIQYRLGRCYESKASKPPLYNSA